MASSRFNNTSHDILSRDVLQNANLSDNLTSELDNLTSNPSAIMQDSANITTLSTALTEVITYPSVGSDLGENHVFTFLIGAVGVLVVSFLIFAAIIAREDVGIIANTVWSRIRNIRNRSVNQNSSPNNLDNRLDVIISTVGLDNRALEIDESNPDTIFTSTTEDVSETTTSL